MQQPEKIQLREPGETLAKELAAQAPTLETCETCEGTGTFEFHGQQVHCHCALGQKVDAPAPPCPRLQSREPVTPWNGDQTLFGPSPEIQARIDKLTNKFAALDRALFLAQAWMRGHPPLPEQGVAQARLFDEVMHQINKALELSL